MEMGLTRHKVSDRGRERAWLLTQVTSYSELKRGAARRSLHRLVRSFQAPPQPQWKLWRRRWVTHIDELLWLPCSRIDNDAKDAGAERTPA